MPFGAGGEFVGGATQPGGGGGGGSGTVTSVSVVSSHGFSGTVATPSTTPAITLSTTVASGLLKSNGSGTIQLASAGTDYIQGPLTGDVTTSGNAATLVGTANVEAIIRANTLNQMAAPTTSLSIGNQALTGWLLALSTITADPSPAVSATYYRCNYAGNGNFTLPSSSVATGTWIRIKNVANNTITIQGTVDGQANTYALTQFQAVMVVYNGTNWDAI